jgi:hypothetical protein
MKLKLSIIVFAIATMVSACSDSDITGISQDELVDFNFIEFRYSGFIHEIKEMIENNNYRQEFLFQDSLANNNYSCGYDIDSSFRTNKDTFCLIQTTPRADTITRITFKFITDEKNNVIKFLRIEYFRYYYLIIGPHFSYASGRTADTIELINVPFKRNYNEITVLLNKQELKNCLTSAKYIKYHLRVDNDNGLGSSKSYMHDIISSGIVDYSNTAELFLKLRKNK